MTPAHDPTRVLPHNLDAEKAVLDALERKTGKHAQTSGDGHTTFCPAHDDQHRSLSVGTGDDGRVLLHCHAGCTVQAICESIGFTPADLFPPKPPTRRIAETYDYRNERGELVFQVVRYEPKEFRQRRPDPDKTGEWIWNLKSTPRIPYRLPEVRTAVARNIPIFIPEGERDVHALEKIGCTATTNAGGAGGWLKKFAAYLQSADIVILPDNDKPGREHAETIAKSLKGIARSVKILALPDLPEKGDVGDWLRGGHDYDELATLAADQPEVDFDALAGKQPPRRPKQTGRTATYEDIPCTETGNAEIIARLHGAQLRYDHRRGRWLVWAEDWWVEDDTAELTRLATDAARLRYLDAMKIQDSAIGDKVSKWARQSENRRVIENSLALASRQKIIADSGRKWDCDPWLLGVENGVLDLRTGELRPGRPDDRITKVAPVEYDSEATCPLWGKFLNRIMDGNQRMIYFLQMLAGYCLTGDIREQILPIFWGDGQNGKNTFLEAVSGLLGPYASEAPPGLLTVKHGSESHPTEIADLCGLRLVVASETEQGARLRIQLVKKLTGDAVLKGRYMHQNFFTFERTHKTVLQTNQQPVVREDTFAVWRRLRLVPFTVVIPEEERDKELGLKLRDEWPGILRWAVEGCLDWQENGLVEPDTVTKATAVYRSEQDVLAEFVETRCSLVPGLFTPKPDLFIAYSEWAKDAKERYPLGKITFFERIGRLPNVIVKQRKVAGKPQRGFEGLGLHG